MELHRGEPTAGALVWSLLSILDLELGRCPSYIRPVQMRNLGGLTTRDEVVPRGTAGSGRGSSQQRLEEHRGALTAHCTRILGSAFEADDAVQETLVRAWCAFDRFEGRASLRTWLHSIATNVCVDMLRSSQRRARPIDLASRPAGTSVGDGQSGVEGIRPIPSIPRVPASPGPGRAGGHA